MPVARQGASRRACSSSPWTRPTDPADAADATFATDNYQAGNLIGKWAKAKFEKEGKQAKIAMLDLNPNGVSVDVQRDQGFLEGFGIDVGDKTKIGDESDPRIVGHDVTDGAEDGGRTAMENLLQKDPSINLVYTINEPAAAGAYAGAARRPARRRTSRSSRSTAAARAWQRQGRAARRDLAAVPAEDGRGGRRRRSPTFAKDGTKPEATEGKTFIDTGVTLITDQPQTGSSPRTPASASENCWG